MMSKCLLPKLSSIPFPPQRELLLTVSYVFFQKSFHVYISVHRIRITFFKTKNNREFIL